MAYIATVHENKVVGITGNPNKTFVELKTIKEKGSCACYEITEAQYLQITDDAYDTVFTDGVITTVKGRDAIDRENARLNQ